MIPTQVRIRAYIRLSKLHTAETEMPILKAEKKTARIPGSSASFEAGGPDYPEQMLYAAVPDRRDVEHPVVLYEYQPNWRTKKRRRNFCRRVHRILTEHCRENGSIKRAC